MADLLHMLERHEKSVGKRSSNQKCYSDLFDVRESAVFRHDLVPFTWVCLRGRGVVSLWKN